MRTVPESGSTNPLAIPRRVDLPEPVLADEGVDLACSSSRS